MSTTIRIADSMIGECVARQGGYEEVERNNKWALIANALGMRKDLAEKVKQRYEDMLRHSAEMDEKEEEDEDEEYEVDEILDSRIDAKGNVEYLVKWKFDGDGLEDESDMRDSTTWEPREHLACPELLEKFEEEKVAKKGKKFKSDAMDAEQQQQPLPTSAAIGHAEEAAASATADDTLRKRKAPDEREANGHFDSSSSSSSSKVANGMGGEAGSYSRVLRMCKPKPGKPLLFEVELADGGTCMIPNSKLRSEAPLLLCDFYEGRISFSAT